MTYFGDMHRIYLFLLKVLLLKTYPLKLGKGIYKM